MGGFDIVELLEDFSRITRQIVSDKDARIAELEAELAKYTECDESDMERLTKCEWHCAKTIYHKERE